jgi:transposase
MRKERKNYSAEEKVAILRRHLLDKVPVSDLCEELGLQPTVFYRWQKEFFENGATAFQTPEPPRRQAEEKQKRIEFLEKKVQTKDEVSFLVSFANLQKHFRTRCPHSLGEDRGLLSNSRRRAWPSVRSSSVLNRPQRRSN